MNRVSATVLTYTDRFGELETREKRAVILLATFLAVVIFYLAIWVPAHEYSDTARQDFDREASLYNYLKSTEGRARESASSGGASGSKSGQSLLSTVSSVARSVGVSPSRLQPEGGDGVSVWFESVPFEQLMLCLERLEYDRGITVKQISIERRDQPGHVSARLVLR